MTKKERAALLARGEEYLAWIEGCFEESIQERDLNLAWHWENVYTGCLRMLEVLDLLSYEESAGRYKAMLDRYICRFHCVPYVAGYHKIASFGGGSRMNRIKKAARRLAPPSGRVQGFHRELLAKLLYQILGKKQAPIWTGEGVTSPCPGNLH